MTELLNSLSIWKLLFCIPIAFLYCGIPMIAACISFRRPVPEYKMCVLKASWPPMAIHSFVFAGALFSYFAVNDWFQEHHNQIFFLSVFLAFITPLWSMERARHAYVNTINSK